MDHKIICWRDYAMPIPVTANWLTWDKQGFIEWWDIKPIPHDAGYWDVDSNPELEGFSFLSSTCWDVPPPEPGPWREQIYWIGD